MRFWYKATSGRVIAVDHLALKASPYLALASALMRCTSDSLNCFGR